MRKGWIKDRPEEYWCIGVKHPFKIDNIDHECTEYFNGDQYTIPTWADINLLPDSYLPPTFTMLVGIPGVGKSTYAKELTKSSSAVWLSSDYIREKLFGDAACQDNHNLVFDQMHDDAISLLNRGFDVIYDIVHACVVACLETGSCECKSQVVGVAAFRNFIVKSHIQDALRLDIHSCFR
jgi:hypothetical protein